MPFVNQRWLGGLLTNFTTIQRSIGRLRELEAMAEDLAACVLRDPRAASVRVTIRKPAAIAGARDAGVEIVRER